jgi:hypothetical protein
MKKAVVITVQALFLTLIVLFGSSEAAIIYSESFVSEQTYCPGSSQYDHWALFRQQLDTNTNNFTSVTFGMELMAPGHAMEGHGRSGLVVGAGIVGEMPTQWN